MEWGWIGGKDCLGRNGFCVESTCLGPEWAHMGRSDIFKITVQVRLKSMCPRAGRGQAGVPKPNFTQFNVLCRVGPWCALCSFQKTMTQAQPTANDFALVPGRAFFMPRADSTQCHL